MKHNGTQPYLMKDRAWLAQQQDWGKQNHQPCETILIGHNQSQKVLMLKWWSHNIKATL